MPADALDRATQLWLATNLLRGTPEATLRAELASRGVAAEDVDAAIEAVRASPVFESALPFVEDARRLQMLSRRADAMLRSVPAARSVARIGVDAIDARFGFHLAEGVPVVIEGAARTWPAFDRWTWTTLRELYGDAAITVARKTHAPDASMPPGYGPKRETTLAQLIDHALDAPSVEDAERMYLVADNRALRGPLAALVEDIAPDPRMVKPDTVAEESHLWLGPAGTRTGWHYDLSHVLMFQLRGRKRVRLVPPTDATMMDHATRTLSELAFEDSRASDAFVRETLLEPGDALFVPVGYWHAVEALDPAITVSLTDMIGPRPPRFRLDGSV